MHRERELALGPGNVHRRRAVLVGAPAGTPARLNREGLRPADLVPAATQALRRQRQQVPFPVSMAEILHLDGDAHVLVLDGEVRRLDLIATDPASRPVHVSGQCRHAKMIGRIDDLVRNALALRLPSLQQWASTTADASSDLDALCGPTPGALSIVDEFVHRRLIPCIGRVSNSKQDSAAGEGLDEAPIADEAKGICLPTWEKRFAFLGSRWCTLIPFSGQARHQTTVTIDGQEYLALETLATKLAVARYDHMLQEAVRAGLATDSDGSSCEALHREGVYCVHRTPRGRTYVSQQQAPYVVEGTDKKLYYFGAAEIGISIHHIEPRAVLHGQCGQVLHHYPHMFVYGMGNVICMPRPTPYYEGLHKMPLEEGLLHHLEQARMTLCAGYLPLSSAVHPIQATGRPTISLSEARRRHLPIYWYDKPRRRLRDQVRSLV